jgi:hypothetical protein
MSPKKRFGYLLLALAVTLACVPSIPSVASLPTQPVGLVETIVAGTYAAAATGTALQITPTATPVDTLTPSPTATITPTGTATIIFKMPTQVIIIPPTSGSGGGGTTSGTAVPTVEYKCTVVKVTPANNSHFVANTNFTTTWRVKNTGNIYWSSNSVDYKFSTGAPLHLQALYDLPTDVAKGGVINLTVSMRAPSADGTYTTVWVLRVGKENFCQMKLTIKVP